MQMAYLQNNGFCSTYFRQNIRFNLTRRQDCFRVWADIVWRLLGEKLLRSFHWHGDKLIGDLALFIFKAQPEFDLLTGFKR